jgi:hypothetical protein
MLDDLRNQTSFQEEEEPLEPIKPKAPKPRKPRRSIDQVTGMTAQQRFVLAVMLFVMVCLLGTMFLLLAGKIVLPFS